MLLYKIIADTHGLIPKIESNVDGVAILGDLLPNSWFYNVRLDVSSKSELDKIIATYKTGDLKKIIPAKKRLREIDQLAFPKLEKDLKKLEDNSSKLENKHYKDAVTFYQKLKEALQDQILKKGQIRIVHGNRDLPEALQYVFGEKMYKPGKREVLGETEIFYYPNACEGDKPLKPGEVSKEDRISMIKDFVEDPPDEIFSHVPPANTSISKIHGKDIGDKKYYTALRKINKKTGKKIKARFGHVHEEEEEKKFSATSMQSYYVKGSLVNF